ncbi:NADP-dependent oxidoreductase [Myroides injenensis]|uniref:NADP-dependent oxidoreductase n=1 Tax=Myroides injenensis TaxID=1183151 RepID=UPI0002884F52|nr:NADP-dependent oxidoreductase [Myroides injenensis]
MKAIVLEKFGGIENLKLREVDKPIIKPNELLVRVKAISINPVDAMVRANKAPLAGRLASEMPLILGWDFSGIIEEIGPVKSEFKIGDEVFGMVNFVGHGKAYAEYIAVPIDQIALKPTNISHEEAAAATLAALTAWQAFNSYGKLRPNDRVLIHAASGGVGHYAIQMAKYLGAYVIGTSSTKNRDFILGLGADEHIDYKITDFEDRLSNIDFVLEAIGKTNFKKSVGVLKKFGTIVTLPSGYTNEDRLAAESKYLHGSYFMSVYSSGEDMNIIADLLEKRIIKSVVSHVFSFEDIHKAHQQIEKGNTIGKIVVRIEE